MREKIMKEINYRLQCRGREYPIINKDMKNAYLYSIYLEKIQYASAEYVKVFKEVIFTEFPEAKEYFQKQKDEYFSGYSIFLKTCQKKRVAI